MPRPTRKQHVKCRHFHWLLGNRAGIYYADGRGVRPGRLGRYSLGTKNYQEALAELDKLDLKKAIELGIAEKPAAPKSGAEPPGLDYGIKLFESNIARPAIMGGPRASTAKRYRPVIKRFSDFCVLRGVKNWAEVDNALVRAYGKWLHEQDYHPATVGFEITLIKGMVKFLVQEGHLPTSALLKIPVMKITTTTTYCYTKAEVKAIIDYCSGRKDLQWFAVVATALAFTGMRISELANLRWAQVDLDRRMIRLRDDTRSARRSEQDHVNSTKSHRDREIGIHGIVLDAIKGLSGRRDEFVFHGPREGRLKPDTVRNVLLRDVLPALSAKFPKTECRPGIAAGRIHSFRHFFCTMCADGNVSEQKLKSLLGHSNSNMIRRYYQPQHDETLKQIDRLSLESGPQGSENGLSADNDA